MSFNLELEKAVKEIKRLKAKRVLIQLPDGLKPKAMEISDFLEKNTKAKIIIWAGTCFGACDLPPEIKDINLTIQFGHSKWPFYEKNVKNTRKRV